MTHPAPPTLDAHLCYLLYATSLKMTQAYKRALAGTRLTYPQYLVMVVLWQQEGLGIKELARRLQQDSGSITPLVKRLEAEGYLVRGRDPADERNRVLTLTAAGHALRADGLRVSGDIAAACGISHTEVQRMMADLATLSAKLDV
jgi:DNA-binding MarR family transcriptional regulator